MRYLNVGGKVLVHIPQGDKVSTTPIMKYHGEEMVISNRVVVGHSNNVYYELQGAVSERWNIPYAFVREWLVQL